MPFCFQPLSLIRKAFAALGLLACIAAAPAHAATANRIVASITNETRTTLPQSVPARARMAADLGAADPALPLTTMTLRFSLSDANQAALTELLLEQQQPGSANYHKWLTPEEYGARFGLSPADLAKVSAWLTGEGFHVTGSARSGTFVTFSGTAAQVEHAFATTIHRVTLNGEAHFTNLTDPALPAALSGVVTSVTGLHDFKLIPRARVRTVVAPVADALHPDFTSSISGNHYLAPGDFYTIYDESPLLANSINGAGVTIAIMGQTDISLSDVAAFRSVSGLPASVPTVKPYGADPGTSTADLAEAQLDVEWSGAAAPGASILYVNSKNVIDISLTQAIDNNLAPIMSVSYGDCEAAYGAANLRGYNLLFQQANAQGITIVGPGGDSGAADCDYNVTGAVSGLAVDYPASSAYVTGIGGTQFNDTSGTYWSSANGTNMGSALSYIPEGVWNETAADTAANGGVATGIAAGGGGASAYFTKPAWQVGTGVPADRSRDVPDLSLNASAAHVGYLFCSSGSCVTGYRGADGQTLDVVGGTSAGTPSFAGLLALVEQKIGSRIGNANPTLYALANSPIANSVFHDVTSGSNSVPCVTSSPNCASSGLGNSIGYNATTGYDLATGWGSVDAFNMVNNWASVTPLGVGAGVGQNASVTTLSSPPTGVVGTSVTITAAVASGTSGTSTTATGTVQILVDGAVTGSAVSLASGTATLILQTASLAAGNHNITVAYSGDATYTGSKGLTTLFLAASTAPDFTLQGAVFVVAVKAGATATGVTYTVSSINAFAGAVTLSATASPTVSSSGGFSVSPVTVAAGGKGTSVFTFSAFTAAATSPTAGQAHLAPLHLAGGSMTFASVLLLLLPRYRRSKRPAGLLSVLLLSVAAFGVTGCSSVVSSVPSPSPNPTSVSAAKGTYLLTITATSGTLTHTTTLTVVVQ